MLGAILKRSNRTIKHIRFFIRFLRLICLRLIVNRKHFAIRKVTQRSQRINSQLPFSLFSQLDSLDIHQILTAILVAVDFRERRNRFIVCPFADELLRLFVFRRVDHAAARQHQRRAKPHRSQSRFLPTLFHGFFLRSFQVGFIIDKIEDFVNFFRSYKCKLSKESERKPRRICVSTSFRSQPAVSAGLKPAYRSKRRWKRSNFL